MVVEVDSLLDRQGGMWSNCIDIRFIITQSNSDNCRDGLDYLSFLFKRVRSDIYVPAAFKFSSLESFPN